VNTMAGQSANKRLEFAHTAGPTRKSDAPLLAAQPRRYESQEFTEEW
jgi:hypothetical protein